MTHPKEERTILIIKPDGVKRGLIGEALHRMEQRGLKIIALKMVTPKAAWVKGFFPGTDAWMSGMGNKTLETYAKYGKDAMKELGTNDALAIGKMIFEWLIEFWTSGPVVATVVEGVHAIDMVRKIIGHTIPSKAEMGTIRGDYSVDSPVLANMDKRAIYNVVHASGDPTEAAHEVVFWFTPEEIHGYTRADDSVMF